MNCPECHASNPEGQRFCGSCGHSLETICPQCDATNPPEYKFCGQCGASLASAGAMTLARSGLITHVTQKVLDLLGYPPAEIQGKPLSLFIEREDLVIFFSHLNELLSSQQTQSFEIALKHKKGDNVYVVLECKIGNRTEETITDLHLSLTEVSETRQASARLQYQQDLLGLIFTITGNIISVSRNHLEHSINDALKKICLFARADDAFIYGISRATRQLDLLYRWTPETTSNKTPDKKRAQVPLEMIKRTIVRLTQEQSLVADQLDQLPASERKELLAWHHTDNGGIVCHLLYSGKRPVAVIGVVKNRAHGEWDPDCVHLIKFFGQFIADRISIPTTAKAKQNVYITANDTTAAQPAKPAPDPPNVFTSGKNRPAADAKAKPDPAESPGKSLLPDTTRPMLLEALEGKQIVDQQPVFPRDDGLVLLSCPRCGCQESVSVGQFDKLGNAIRVSCTCEKEFTAVLEKRRAFRKAVRLDGYFTLSGDIGPSGTSGSIWGPMVVKDLSKAGLRFSSKKAAMVKAGDLLMVRFNLDNSNAALIHKPARVISATDEEVGCKFEGSDNYDITLGFYFI